MDKTKIATNLLNFLSETDKAIAGIMIVFYEGRRHVVSAEDISAYTDVNGLAGFPAFDIHEKMMMHEELKKRLKACAAASAARINERCIGDKQDAAMITEEIYEGLLRAVQIDIPTELN